MSSDTPSPESTHPAFASPAFRQLLGGLALILTVVFTGYFVLPWLTTERKHRSESERDDVFTTGVNVEEATPEAVTALYTDLTSRMANLLQETNDVMRAKDSLSDRWSQINAELESLQARVTQIRYEENAEQAKANWARDAAKQAMVDLAALLTELDTWESEFQPLLTNDTGRKIATDDQRVELVAAAFTRPRPDVTRVRTWMNDLLKILQLYSDAESVSVEHRDEIKVIANSATTNLRHLKADREQVEFIIKSVARHAAGETTLEAALEPYR